MRYFMLSFLFVVSLVNAFDAPPLPEQKSLKTLPPPMQIPSVTFPFDVRQPTGVNLYYPADANILRRQLSALDQPTVLEPVPGLAKVFIAPWGTIDGALVTAAKVYQYLRARGDVKTIIMMARPHGDNLAGPASVWNQGGYATPLGIAKINALAAKRLAANLNVNYERLPHITDGAIETNVLLAQHFLPDAMIVPLLINPQTRADFETLSQLLAKVVGGQGVVLVAISNLSYGFAETELAGRSDLQTMGELQTMDLNIINNIGKKRSEKLAGDAGIMDAPKVIMMSVLTALLLEMDTLTWFGYEAIRQFPGAPLITGVVAGAFSARAQKVIVEKNVDGLEIISVDSGRLSAEAENELLTMARDSLEAASAQARYDTPYPRSPELLKQRAVFITVLNRGDQRELASMGTFSAEQRLCIAATDAARMCAVGEDPQMEKRLDSISARTATIELAVLKNQKVVGSWTEIKNGQGVLIARGTGRAVVLPTTALRRHWSVEDMLAFACKRAGLRPDAYRNDKVDIITFDVDIYTQDAK